MKNNSSKLKKFSAVLCGVGVLCSGFALAGCGQEIVDIDSVQTLNEVLAGENVEGKVLRLTNDLTLNTTLLVKNTITIDGQGKYTIKADTTWEGKTLNLLSLEDTTARTLTLKNVTIDGNDAVRCVYAKGSNTLKVNGATITNGSRANTYAPGVFITEKAHFEMTSGKVTGNDYPESVTNKDAYEYVYSQDLWIGANATGKISGGEIGNMFVNSNEYSSLNEENFLQVTVNGGKIENAYIEYAKETEKGTFGATLRYKSGEITNLYVAQDNDGVAQKVEALTKNTTYQGGKNYNA